IPVVGSLADGLARRPNALLIGIAPPGGQLPASWRALILDAIDHRLEIWSGLHTILGDDAELAARARKAGVTIHDLRKPPGDIDVARGRVREIDDKATVILTVGTDCNIGKMTTQLQLRDAMRARGMRVAFAPTGQTGILVEGWGISVDAVIAEFIDMQERAAAPLRPAPVIAVALNTFDLSDADARAAIERVSRETDLPATDPVRFDPAPIVDAIDAFHRERFASPRRSTAAGAG